MSESDQDRPERDGYERDGHEAGGPAPDRPERDAGRQDGQGGRGAAGAAPAAPPEHLALLADGVVELRKRGGIAARRTGPQDGGPPAGEAAVRDAHYAAGNGVPDPCLEAMARRAADRAGRPRA